MKAAILSIALALACAAFALHLDRSVDFDGTYFPRTVAHTHSLQDIGHQSASRWQGTMAQVWREADEEIRKAYASSPVLAIGLSALLLIPFLAIVGWLFQPSRSDRASNELSTEIILAPPPPFRVYLRVGTGNDMELPIARDVVGIGRHEDNDVCLNNAAVRRHHALIHREADATYWLTDISGTVHPSVKVNGRAVKSTPLSAGDRLLIGDCDLVFEIDAWMVAAVERTLPGRSGGGVAGETRH